MVIQQTSFNHFFSRPNTEFVIPVYQRNYAWQKLNCKQLLDNILAVAKDPNKQHFLGTITYIRPPYTTFDNKQPHHSKIACNDSLAHSQKSAQRKNA